MHVGQCLAAHQLGLRLEIQIHLVIVIDHRFRRGFQLRVHHLDHRRVRQTEQRVLDLQPHGSGQAEIGHSAIRNEVIGIVRLILTGIAQGGAGGLKHDEARQRQQPRSAAQLSARQQMAAKYDQRRQRHKGQQDKGQTAHDDLQHGGEEIAHHIAGHLHDEAKAPIGLEIALAAVFDACQHRPAHAQDIGDDVSGLPGQQIHQRRQQQAHGSGKQQDIHQRHPQKLRAAVKYMHQQLMIDERQRKEKQRPQAPLRGILRRLLQMCVILVLHRVSLSSRRTRSNRKILSNGQS